MHVFVSANLSLTCFSFVSIESPLSDTTSPMKESILIGKEKYMHIYLFIQACLL